ncbi:MAG: DNA polymerase III subunit delta [Cyclobacteriaceae bacterium]
MRFADIPGLDEEKSVLVHAVQNNHVAHAQLFYGIAGSGNFSMALAYATFLNCENPTADDSCGACVSCIKTDKHIHPDVHYIFPKAGKQKEADNSNVSAELLATWRNFILENPYMELQDWAEVSGLGSKQLSISKDDSKHIIKTVSMKAFEAKYKIMLIWMPETMNASSANTILKVLEEPPTQTIFLLVSNDYEKLLTTIISRTQLFKVPRFDEKDIVKYLIEKSAIPEPQALQAARVSQGSLSAAIKIASQVEDDSHQLFRDWMRECWTLDILSINKRTGQFNDLNKSTQKTLILYGLNMLRESLMCQLADSEPVAGSEEESKFIVNFSKNVSSEKIEQLSNLLNTMHLHLERNGNPKIIFLDTSMQFSSVLRSK